MKQKTYYSEALAYLRDYMAYRLEQVKSQIYNHYCEKGVRDV